jgi:hypothetical protein
MWFWFISIKLNNFTHFKDTFSLKVFYFTAAHLATFMLKRQFSSKVYLGNIINSSALICFSKIK